VDGEATFLEGLRVFPRSVFLRTGYSSYLVRNSKPGEAKRQLEMAIAVNKGQAESWYFAHANGIDNLSVAAIKNEDLMLATKLLPETGAIALTNYQRLSNKPSE